jgi:hypothetical protein
MEWFVQTADGRTLAVEDADENRIGEVHAWLTERS